MNLIGEPWIPVVFSDGEAKKGESTLVGLRELFERSADIRDLAVTPPQRVALMRLLLCITQAALDGPADENDWRGCRDRIVPEGLSYLESRRDKFELYGEQPFLQVANLTTDESHAIDEIDDRPSLFNHNTTERNPARTDAWAALNLLTLLNFSRQGRVGQGIWHGVKLNQSTFEAPCVNKVHSFIRGQSLCDALHFNLLSKSRVCAIDHEAWGCPVWDKFPLSPKDDAAFVNASTTYLGRLVPLSRFVLLVADAERPDHVASQAIISPTYPDLDFRVAKMKGRMPAMYFVRENSVESREPSTTIMKNRKTDESYCLKIDIQKHIWREASSVLALSESMSSGGVPAIQNLRVLSDVLERIDIWSGGMCVVNNAKIDCEVEWTFSVPAGLLNDLKGYESGVQDAEEQANRLWWAVTEYLDLMALHKDDRKTRDSIRKHTHQIFWHELDQRYELLIAAVNTQREADYQKWKSAIVHASNKAYEQSCPRLTARQMKAFVAGRKRLYPKNSSDDHREEGGEA